MNMTGTRVMVACGAVLALLAGGCSGSGAPAGGEVTRKEFKDIEARVAALEGAPKAVPVAAAAPAPAPGADLAGKVAALEARLKAMGAGSALEIGIPNDKGKDVWGCVKVEKGLAVTGRADDPRWKRAKQVQLVSDEGKRLACDTAVAICHDTENFYIAAVCMESAMDKLRITCKNRDDKIYKDDCVEFYIDQELDRNDCVKFVVNPDGVFMDFLRGTSGDAGDVTWNATVKTSKLADRFVMEIAIPLADMGVKYKPGMEMGFNAFRMRTVNGESSTWWGECNKIASIGKAVLE